MKKKLKDYSIKIKIIIEEWHKRIKDGSVYDQPFKCYSANIEHSTYSHSAGGFKNKKELLKFIGENL